MSLVEAWFLSTSSAKAQVRVVSVFDGLPDERMLIYADGIGLACGIFEHLLNIKDPPKVIAATHFHEIFENGFLAPRPGLQLGHMEVKLCEEFQEVEDQVTYLYKFAQHYSSPRWIQRAKRSHSFRPGRSSKSFGTMYEPLHDSELLRTGLLTRR